MNDTLKKAAGMRASVLSLLESEASAITLRAHAPLLEGMLGELYGRDNARALVEEGDVLDFTASLAEAGMLRVQASMAPGAHLEISLRPLAGGGATVLDSIT